MRHVPHQIASALNSTSAVEPTLYADIYHQTEGSDSLSTAYRIRGDGEVSIAEDSGVEFDLNTSSMMLSHGTAQALDTASAVAAGSQILNWDTYVTDIYQMNKDIAMRCAATYFGYCVLWLPQITRKYFHQGYRYRDGDNVTEKLFRFTNQSSKQVDSLAIGIGNASGNLPVSVSVDLVDAESGSPVGSSASITIAAGSAHATRTIGGAMGARLFSGRDYVLRIQISPVFTGGVRPSCSNQAVDERYGCTVTLSGLSTSAADWVIHLLHPQTNVDMGKVTLGGLNQFSISGTVVRNFDVGVIPSADGVLGITSTSPIGTTLDITSIYATNSDSVAAEVTTTPAHWTTITPPYADGMALSPYRFWRIIFTLNSNTGRDESPQLADVSIAFSGTPLTLGTVAGAVSDASGVRAVQAVRAINSVSASAQSINPSLKSTMVGQFSMDLAPEPEVIALARHKLRGKRVVIRAGVRGIDMTMPIHTGVVRDLSWSGGKFILTLQDPFEMADVSVPNLRHADWSAAVTYALGDLKVSGDKAYRSQQNGNLNHAVTDAAWWEAYPSVWLPLTYVSGTHLADIVIDLLSNRVNLQDRYIDTASILAIKAIKTGRTITATLTIDNPVAAKDLLDELAMLLEAQWVMRAGRLALLPDASASDAYVEQLGRHDIKEGIEWRRGFSDIKNTVLIYSGYTTSGSSEQFSRGQAIVDATSVGDYGMTAMREIKDRFGLSASELTAIANNYLARWANGKRLIRCDAYLNKLSIESGDVVRIISPQLPESEPQDIKCITIQSSLDWLSMSMKLTLLEV